jgi:hypothetical protein
MPDYVIKGFISDNVGNKMTDVRVQAMNSDHRLLHYHDDEMLGNVWVNTDGKFEIPFDRKDFYASFLENNPDIYLIIRNKLGQIIKKTEIRKGVKPSDIQNLTFEIKLDSTEVPVPYSDNPYSNSIDIVMSSFGKLNESIDIRPGDYLRVSELLISTINAWTLYTNEPMWKVIGYDGPQVPRYPWKQNDRPFKKLWIT